MACLVRAAQLSSAVHRAHVHPPAPVARCAPVQPLRLSRLALARFRIAVVSAALEADKGLAVRCGRVIGRRRWLLFDNHGCGLQQGVQPAHACGTRRIRRRGPATTPVWSARLQLRPGVHKCVAAGKAAAACREVQGGRCKAAVVSQVAGELDRDCHIHRSDGRHWKPCAIARKLARGVNQLPDRKLRRTCKPSD